MNITLNGEQKQFEAPMNVTELVKVIELKQRLFVVELNQNIINKDQYDSTQVNDGDDVEIVCFVGGG